MIDHACAILLVIMMIVNEFILRLVLVGVARGLFFFKWGKINIIKIIKDKKDRTDEKE